MGTPADFANDCLAALQAQNAEGAVISGERLVPGLWFDIDPAAESVEARHATGEQALLSVRASAARPGRWFTLNVDLGDGDLSALRLIGFAARARAPRSMAVRACLRSFRAGRFEDTFFPQYLVAFAEESSHADVLWIDSHPALRNPADWRTLLLFLEPAGFEIVFRDLRVFAA